MMQWVRSPACCQIKSTVFGVRQLAAALPPPACWRVLLALESAANKLAGGEGQQAAALHLLRRYVFPTGVGVNRCQASPEELGERIPHARGGEPTALCACRAGFEYSPRAWG